MRLLASTPPPPATRTHTTRSKTRWKQKWTQHATRTLRSQPRSAATARHEQPPALPFGVASVVEHALLVEVAHGGSALAYTSVPACLALGRAGGPRSITGQGRVGVAAGDLAQQQGFSLGLELGHGGSPGPRRAGRRRRLLAEAQQ